MIAPLAGRTLALVHTVPPLVDVFRGLVAELLPGARPLHILDEPLLEAIKVRGGLDGAHAARLAAHVACAAEAGAHAVLVTCSTVSPLVDQVRPGAALPVLKIDEAMIRAAVSRGSRIGVVATAASTLEPTRLLLETEAARCGARVEVELALVEGALPALLAGAGATHDAAVAEAAVAVAERCDVVVLAQASMARALPAIEALGRGRTMSPVLSSPHAALAQARAVLTRSDSDGGIP
jgi:Asp/Glu/hydantoin racemase